jgi:hypothetical protein
MKPTILLIVKPARKTSRLLLNARKMSVTQSLKLILIANLQSSWRKAWTLVRSARLDLTFPYRCAQLNVTLVWSKSKLAQRWQMVPVI